MIKKSIKDYYAGLLRALGSIEVTLGRPAKAAGLAEGLERAIGLIRRSAHSGGKIIFIGNGAGASMASHQAVDFWKASGIPALCFNDAALLTCISNDFGYERVFEKPLGVFLKPADVLVALSSSGRSPNILRAAAFCRKKKAVLITLSGFGPNNPLRKKGDINFYVPAETYGLVEVAHHAILHGLLDTLVGAVPKRTR